MARVSLSVTAAAILFEATSVQATFVVAQSQERNEEPAQDEVSVMSADADRIVVIERPKNETGEPKVVATLKGPKMDGLGGMLAQRWKDGWVDNHLDYVYSWIVFLKQVDEAENWPRVEPITTKNWAIPATDELIAKVRARILTPADWSNPVDGEVPMTGMLEIYEDDDSHRPILQSICLPTDVNGRKLLSQRCIFSATHVKHARFSVFVGDMIGSARSWKYWLDLTAYQANFPQPERPDFPSQETNGIRQHGESSVADATSALERRASEQPHPANSEPQPQHPEDVRADKAYDAFLKTRDYGAMLDIVKSWKQKLDQASQKEIVIRLMRGLGSTKTTPANEEHVAIMWRVMKRREPRRTPDNREWTWQDLLIEGGRCAWALERLLEYDLPPIHEELTADERQAAVTESQARIVRAMEMPPTVNATALPEFERIKVAESERTHPRVLVELAGDTSVAVRRAVASNRFTPPHMLKKLYEDPDPEVAERAQKNFILITPLDRPR